MWFGVVTDMNKDYSFDTCCCVIWQICKKISEELTAFIRTTHDTYVSRPDPCYYFYVTWKQSIPIDLWPPRWRQHIVEKVGACLLNYTSSSELLHLNVYNYEGVLLSP